MQEALSHERVKLQTETQPKELLFWWVGELEFEVELNHALNGCLAHTTHSFVLQHIADSTALTYHRPRAPEVHLAFAFPSTTTWSRARSASPQGLPQLRSATWPWGVPNLKPEHRAAVEFDNAQLRLALEMCEILRAVDRPWILSFPEQFGSTQGKPSPSPWDAHEIRLWARTWKIWRFALWQCELGAMRPRSTGVLANIPLSDKRFRQGWPTLSLREDGKAEYTGPLRKFCACTSGHPVAQARLAGNPWDPASLLELVKIVLLRCLDRELLSGWGRTQAAAAQGAGDSEAEDSEETVPEPASPAPTAGLGREEPNGDPLLCDALRTLFEDSSIHA